MVELRTISSWLQNEQKGTIYTPTNSSAVDQVSKGKVSAPDSSRAFSCGLCPTHPIKTALKENVKIIFSKQ